MSPRKGPTWPTLARELLDARERLTVLDTVVLAVRADRHRRGLSQRAYAAARGWSKSFVGRLETRPGELPFGSVLEALHGTGAELVLRRTAPADAQDTGAEAVIGARDGDAVIGADEWPASELLARDDAGRRLPAHHVARRLVLPHYWWQVRHAYETWRPDPQWTAEQRRDG